MSTSNHYQQVGFTLVEMIMVIVITGIIGGMVAVFLRAPIQQYMDVSRRAELTDIADTALRRMTRDIRTAVPNSVSSPSATSVNFLPAKTGGRYRANAFGGAGGCEAEGDDLAFFPTADTCFEVIGPTVQAAANDYLVVGSTQSDAAPPYDATITGVLRQITLVGSSGVPAVQNIRMAGVALPVFAQLDSQRFQVVDVNQKEVIYACDAVSTNAAGDGTGVLRRYWGIPFTHSTTGAASAVLADKVSGCQIEYGVPNQRFGLLAVRLTLTSGGESVSLYNEIHVNNAP